MPVGAVPFPFGVCRICKDRATGVHYGVATCEGCKGFFKRSITRGDKYKCFFGEECEVTPKNRNRCKSCRFRKCLEVGMSIEGVRMGRIPKAEKEKALEVFQQGGSDYSNLELQVEQTGTGSYDFKINSKPEFSDQTGSEKTDTNIVSSQTQENQSDQHVQKYFDLPRQGGFGLENLCQLPNDGCMKQTNLTSGVKVNTVSPQAGQDPLKVCFSDMRNFNTQLHTSDSEHPYESSAYKSCPGTTGSFNHLSPNLHQNFPGRRIPCNTDIKDDFQISATRFSSDFGKTPADKPSVLQRWNSIDNPLDMNSSFQASQVSPLKQEIRNNPGLQFQNMNCRRPPEKFSSNHYQPRNSFNMSHIRSNDMNSYSAPEYQENGYLCMLPSESNLDTSVPHFSRNTFPATGCDLFQSGSSIQAMADRTSISCSVDETSSISHNPEVNSQAESHFQSRDFSRLHSSNSEPSSKVWSYDYQSSDPHHCSSPSSVVSGGGSSSKSSFSPSVIQLLIEHVVESNQAGTIAEKLKERLKKTRVDSTVIQRLISLIDNAVEMDGLSSGSARLSHLPENKFEGMNRFLFGSHSSDIQNCGAPLPKKKRCVFSEELNAPFENLGVIQLSDYSSKGSTVGRLSEHGQQSLVAMEPETVPTIQSADMKFLTEKLAAGSGEDAEDDITSTQREDADSEKESRILCTLETMELAVKILNRFKPEHRDKIRLFKDGKLHLKILTDSEEDCKVIYSKLLEGIPGLNDRILGFCNSVPGFEDLSSEDKKQLTKRHYYDLWTLSYAEYFQDRKSYWILPSGEIYSAEAMRKILNDEMVDTIMTFSDKFNGLKLSDLEIGLFGALRLTATDGIELADKEAVEAIHSHVLDCLEYEMRKNHYSNYIHLLMEMFNLVPLIDAINRIQSEIIANFSVKRYKEGGDPSTLEASSSITGTPQSVSS